MAHADCPLFGARSGKSEQSDRTSSTEQRGQRQQSRFHHFNCYSWGSLLVLRLFFSCDPLACSPRQRQTAQLCNIIKSFSHDKCNVVEWFGAAAVVARNEEKKKKRRLRPRTTTTIEQLSSQLRALHFGAAAPPQPLHSSQSGGSTVTIAILTQLSTSITTDFRSLARWHFSV